MSKSKRSSKSGRRADGAGGTQTRGIVIACILFSIMPCLWAISEFWPGPSLEAVGRVIGKGCADSKYGFQTRPIDNCQLLYSRVVFTDAHGQLHEFHRPEDDLEGTVIVHYRFIALPGNITLGVSVDGQDPRWVRGSVGAILSLMSLAMAGLAVLDSRKKARKATTASPRSRSRAESAPSESQPDTDDSGS